MQFAANLEAMFTDYGLRKSYGLKDGRDSGSVYSMYDSKDYYYGYEHIVDEKILYSESNKQMSRGNVTMNIPRDGSVTDNSTLTIEIGFVIRKISRCNVVAGTQKSVSPSRGNAFLLPINY